MNFTPAQRQTLSWLGLGALALLLLWLLAPVLMPFVMGTVLAYALHPAVESLAARRIPRALAVVLVELVVGVLVVALLLLVVPILTKELPQLRDQIPQLADRLNRTVSPWLASHGVTVALDVVSIKAFVLKYVDANFEEWAATALSSARIGGSFALAIIGNVVLVPVVAFYLLLDWPHLVRRVRALVPSRMLPAVDSFFADCDRVLGQYLRGQLMVMVSLAVLYSVALAVAGFELALPVGVFSGMAVFIPYLGFGLGMVLALLAGVLQFASWYGVAAVAVIYGCGQLLESFVLTPRLVGERIGLSPLMVIFALLAFGQLLGFVGVLVALPLSAVLVVAGGRLRAAYLSSGLYTG